MGDAYDRVVFASPMVRIGAFRCAPNHPRFEDSGPIENYCFVFPRTSVAIELEGQQPFVVNPNVVPFYNRGQLYRRRAISSDGDRCEWFSIAPEVARDTVRAFDPQADSGAARPFHLTRGWSDPGTYLAQRQLFNCVISGKTLIPPLWVEEQVVLLLDRVLRTTYGRTPLCPIRRDALHHVEVLLSERWDRPLRLPDLAAEAEMSAYHLCRTFRRMTGFSLHQYQLRLRLRASLEAVCESKQPLVDVALGAGFSSHSHFTSAFHEEFGRPPSVLRTT